MTALEKRHEIELEDFKIKVQDFLSGTNINQSNLSKMANVSSSILSSTLSGKYPGKVDDVIKKVMSVIVREYEKEKQTIKDIDFVETSVFDRITNALDIASWDNEMIVIIGEAGMGKTRSLKEYQDRDPSCILIEVDNTFSIKTLLEEIAIKLDIGTNTHRTSEIAASIIKKLKFTKRMLIIDEAEYLKSESLDILRRIHDKAEIPVALVGLEKLFTNVISKRHAQIYSRMSLCKLVDIDKKNLVKDSDNLVKTVFKEASNPILKTFYSKSKGNTRLLLRLVKNTQRVLMKNNTDLNIDAIEKASETLIIG